MFPASLTAGLRTKINIRQPHRRVVDLASSGKMKDGHACDLNQLFPFFAVLHLL
jgi:hypothetical protein